MNFMVHLSFDFLLGTPNELLRNRFLTKVPWTVMLRQFWLRSGAPARIATFAGSTEKTGDEPSCPAAELATP
jgi:hypothetical protein